MKKICVIIFLLFILNSGAAYAGGKFSGDTLPFEKAKQTIQKYIQKIHPAPQTPPNVLFIDGVFQDGSTAVVWSYEAGSGKRFKRPYAEFKFYRFNDNRWFLHSTCGRDLGDRVYIFIPVE